MDKMEFGISCSLHGVLRRLIWHCDL